ncbi:GNAT family N-acetyltransferase [Thalassotalea sp. 1_MG-2023]|uniref:GNAT family N-acetyltransferase n=1 Tax=Thalassotalea sp. 1_MG-2023 TaxID=3062680 RepID=UPI0026E48167|nr:GNAT family N-acetyltransferase [Thalassotalea sp. 1_MG-2023]MDO6425509.1 GNAT family N-acetyltransferase [Thalassotalea sp. 1_MG-2023]
MEYRILTLSDLSEEYWQQRFSPQLFEHSLFWLQATEQYVTKQRCKLHTLWCDEQLVAALPLYQERGFLGAKVLKNLISFYSTEVSFLVNKDYPQSGQLLYDHIINANRWHLIELGPIVSERLSFHYLNTVVAQQTNWFIHDIDSEDTYFSTRPSRLKNTLKRKNKQLVKHNFRFQIADDPTSVKQMFTDYQAIYQQSWKGQEYSDDFILAACLNAQAEQKLCFATLYIDEIPAASQIWFTQENQVSIFKLAYDPQFSSLSVGSLLSEYMTKHVLNHYGMRHIEFGMGNERYKQDWMNEKQHRYCYLVFNTKSIIGILAWLRYSVLASFKKTLTGWLGKNSDDST